MPNFEFAHCKVRVTSQRKLVSEDLKNLTVCKKVDANMLEQSTRSLLHMSYDENAHTEVDMP
jgi:hypothetical protein